jgi:hypothetical protein
MSNYPSYDAPPPGYPQQPARSGGAGLAIAALVLGVLALLSCWTVLGGILFGLIALVLGFVASGRAKRGRGTGRGMAITGIVLGLIGLLISVAFIAIGVSFLNSESGQTLQQCLSEAGDDQAAVRQCQQDFEDDVRR